MSSDEILSERTRSVNTSIPKYGLFKLRLDSGLVLERNRSFAYCEGFASVWNRSAPLGDSLVEIIPQNEVPQPMVN